MFSIFSYFRGLTLQVFHFALDLVKGLPGFLGLWFVLVLVAAIAFWTYATHQLLTILLPNTLNGINNTFLSLANWIVGQVAILINFRFQQPVASDDEALQAGQNLELQYEGLLEDADIEESSPENLNERSNLLDNIQPRFISYLDATSWPPHPEDNPALTPPLYNQPFLFTYYSGSEQTSYSPEETLVVEEEDIAYGRFAIHHIPPTHQTSPDLMATEVPQVINLDAIQTQEWLFRWGETRVYPAFDSDEFEPASSTHGSIILSSTNLSLISEEDLNSEPEVDYEGLELLFQTPPNSSY